MKIVSLAVAAILLVSGSVSAQWTRATMTTIKRAGVFPLRTKPTKEQKKLLQPHPQDLATYQTLLAQPRTGIVKLLPDIGCFENANILKVDDACRNAVPESSYYSFREREYTLEVLADIRLRGGHLITDGLLTQGFIANLGDRELDDVSLDSAGFSFIRQFAPDPAALAAKDQYMQLIRGVRTDGHEYKKVVRAVENSTYAMRVVAYRGNVFRSFRGWKFDLLEGDKRIDITLAFRVIRTDTDGSVTIVWRELDRRDSPRIRFPKRGESKPTA